MSRLSCSSISEAKRLPELVMCWGCIILVITRLWLKTDSVRSDLPFLLGAPAKLCIWQVPHVCLEARV